MKNRIAMFIATWFYTGLIPPVVGKGMAGTYGSFFSIPIVWLALWLSNNIFSEFYLIIILIIAIIGLWSVSRAELILGPRTDWKGKTKTRDQNQIVIDEVLGMLITSVSLPVSNQFLWLFLGFIFFRLFDIIKIPPANYFDKMKNSFGVMMDDVVAGIYALLFLQLIIFFFNS